MLRLPSVPLLTGLRLIPDRVHSQILAQAFTHLLRGQTWGKRLAALQGKRIGIAITDANILLNFEVTPIGLRAVGKNPAAWDVRISGSLADFWRLASRQEDPDTLFFNRRLCLEGDTETGLYIKNLLDAMEYDGHAHLAAVLGKPLAMRLWPVLQRLSAFAWR